jgi:hypothetical protein
VRRPTKWKIAAYVAAWIGALVATDPTFGLVPLIYMFPLGLFAFFFPEHRQDGGWFVLISVLLIYVVHAFFYFRVRTTLTSAIPVSGPARSPVQRHRRLPRDDSRALVGSVSPPPGSALVSSAGDRVSRSRT